MYTYILMVWHDYAKNLHIFKIHSAFGVIKKLKFIYQFLFLRGGDHERSAFGIGAKELARDNSSATGFPERLLMDLKSREYQE